MNTIHLAWCCDNNYAQHMGVSLCSALHNLSRDTQAHIYIVYSKLSRSNKEKITGIINSYNASAHFIRVNKDRFAGLKITLWISPAAYFRIALPDLLPQSVSKVLYLDCDLIVRDDLTQLFNIDISAFYVGAVPAADLCCSGMNVQKWLLGMPHDAKYFNSGVLLINLGKWRQDDMPKKLFEFIRNNPEKIRWWDQDALNIFFYNSYQPVDHRWNFTIYHMEMKGIYNDADIAINHFAGYKPWLRDCPHPLTSEYYQYLHMTPWRGFKPKKPRAVQMIGKLISKIPQTYRKISGIYRTRQGILSGDLPDKKHIADCRTRYAFKSILINNGILKNPEWETVFDYRVHFFNYATFMLLFDEIFIDNDYRFDATCTKPFIIDCGSNIGMSVFYFKKLYPSSKILAFEPDEAAFDLLEKNVRGNRLEDVQLHNSAVSDREAEIDFYYDSNFSGSLLMSTFKRDCSSLTADIQPMLHVVGMPQSSKRVKSVLLSTYINEPVDFLKMDIEGSEHTVIKELAQSGKLKLIKKMVIEYHHHIHPDSKGLAGFLEMLESNDFDYQLSADYSNFNVGVGKLQNMLIFAYNKKMPFR